MYVTWYVLAGFFWKKVPCIPQSTNYSKRLIYFAIKYTVETIAKARNTPTSVRVPGII
jgi:hypothetical protein